MNRTRTVHIHPGRFPRGAPNYVAMLRSLTWMGTPLALGSDGSQGEFTMYKLTSFGMALAVGVLFGISGCGTAVSQDAAKLPMAATVSSQGASNRMSEGRTNDAKAPTATDTTGSTQLQFVEAASSESSDSDVGVFAEAEHRPAGESATTQGGKRKPKPQDVGPLHVNTRKMVGDAVALIEKGQPQQAIRQYLDPVINRFAAHYQNDPRKIYCSRTLPEAMIYLHSQPEGHSARDAVVLVDTWADAYYFKGYALMELGDAEAAATALDQALALSPASSRYLAERGHVYQMRRDWNNAKRMFEEAVKGAEFAPTDLKQSEKARALRGIGFTLIELGQLDQAEAKFQECLRLNPSDDTAQNELLYIEQLRRKMRSNDHS